MNRPALTDPSHPSRPASPSRRPRGRLRRTLSGAALAAALVLVPVGFADAHVSVHPDDTTAGAESSEMTFRVPTESDTASTVGVELTLPTTNPLAEVLARPLPGWTVTVTTAKLPKPVVIDGTTFTEAPATVTWTAVTTEARVKPGQYQDFTIQGGPLPESGDVTFTAKQTYSDGSVVNWNQPQPAGADEPEHPAPSFAITPAAAVAVSADHSVASSDSDSDSSARWMAGGALALGVVALAAAGLGLRRRPSSQP